MSPSCRNDPYLSGVPVSVINSWYQREGYIKSMADLISKELESFSEPAQVLLMSGVAILMQLNLPVWSDNMTTICWYRNSMKFEKVFFLFLKIRS